MTPDPLAPARGCVNGLALAGLGWLVVFGALIALAGCDEPETGGTILAPPERYQGNAIVVVRFDERLEIERICSERVGHYAMACADVGRGSIYTENPCGVQDGWYAELLCHELAHRNGWPADHRR